MSKTVIILPALLLGFCLSGCATDDSTSTGADADAATGDTTGERDTAGGDAAGGPADTPDAEDDGCGDPAAIMAADPCITCTCDEATGALVCTPFTVGASCEAGCCEGAGTCHPCEGDHCPTSGLVCAADAPEGCDDGADCTTDAGVCQGGLCGCFHADAPDGTWCDADPTTCTEGDTCVAGACTESAAVDPDDGNPCTDDACVSGQLVHSVNQDLCDDGNPCTLGDHCELGGCIPKKVQQCKGEACDGEGTCDPEAGGCVFEELADGAPCGDDDPCVEAAACDNGDCVVSDGLACDDANPCTADSCEGGACSYLDVDDGAACDDDDPCNGAETCQAGECAAGTALDCPDDGPCLAGSCDAAGGCVTVALADGLSCADDDLCDGAETCLGGACTDGTALSCDDGDTCTADSCGGGGQCEYVAIPDCTAALPKGTTTWHIGKAIVTGSVPAGTTTITASLWGAGGGGCSPGAGGAGAWVTGTLPVTAGQIVELRVASGGAMDGGGGGASYLLVDDEVVMVAGGGGGAGCDGCGGCQGTIETGAGGAGGPAGGTGQAGTLDDKYGTGSGSGTGGEQAAGGSAGTSNNQSIYDNCTLDGEAGGPNRGGRVGKGMCSQGDRAEWEIGAPTGGGNGTGGGGGSGYFGGGSGAGMWTYSGGGGGGGSSYTAPSVVAVSSEGGSLMTPGGATAPGYGFDAARGGGPGESFVDSEAGTDGLIVLTVP